VLITFTQIKQQYRTLAKRYHPDREHSVLTDEDKLKKINEAYAVVKKYRTLFAD
jgi:DnaJ-class molecular chaperone